MRATATGAPAKDWLARGFRGPGLQTAPDPADTRGMASATPDRNVEYWCRGAKRTGRRPLTVLEHEWLVHLRRRHGGRLFLGLSIFPTAVALPLVLQPLMHPLWGAAANDVLGLALSAAGLFALPVTILLARDHAALWRSLGRDLRAGCVDVYEFPRPHEGDGDEADGPGPAVPAGFAMMPVSRRIVVATEPRTTFHEEIVHELDAHPSTEFYAPLSLRVASDHPDLEFAQRPLSVGERGELDELRRRLSWPRFSTAVAFLTMALLLGLARWVAEGYADRTPHWREVIFLVLAMTICVRALMRYTRSVLLAGRLGRDLETGLVVRVVGGEPHDAEMLPFSRLFWRVAGAPAEWRDRRRGAETLRGSL